MLDNNAEGKKEKVEKEKEKRSQGKNLEKPMLGMQRRDVISKRVS